MNNKFKSNIKHAFDGLENDIDPELIWSGINATMEKSKNKKRRFFIWWIFGLGIGSVVLFTLMYTLGLNHQNELQVVLGERGNKPLESILSRAEIESTYDSIEEETDESSLDLSEQVKSVEQKSVNKSSNIFEKSADQNASKNYKDSQYITETQTRIQNPSGYLSSRSIHSALFPRTADNDNQSLIEVSRNEIAGVLSLGTKNVISIQSNEVGESVPHFEYPSLRLPHNNLDKSKSIRFLNAVEIYNGISFGSKSVVSLNQTYTVKRNASEKLLEELHMGARFQLIQLLDFKLLTGLKYSRINDSWTMNLQYPEDLPITYVDSRTEYPDGEIEDHFTTDTLEHTIIRYVKQYNTEQLLSVPFELRYGKQVNNWSFAVGAGVEFSYLFSADHIVLGLDGLPIDISTEGRWLNPNFSAGVFTSYTFSPQWSITGNLNYKKLSVGSNSIVSDLKSNYTMFGIDLGIAWNFIR